MAKKKSKRFIVPSFHFLTTNPPTNKSSVSTVPSNLEKQQSQAKKTKSIQKPLEKPTLKPSQISKKIDPPKGLEIEKKGRRNSALSLSSLKRNKEEEAKFKKKQEQSKELKNQPKDPFTEATFLGVWDKYIEDLHQKGEKILASILKADSPKLKGHMIHVIYPNEMMKVELLKVRPKVLRYLRDKLNNYDVDFVITVNEVHTKRFAYTPQEKYELLREKNEALALLRKKFNLDL